MGNIICIIDGMTDEDFCIYDYENLSAAMQYNTYGEFLTVPTGLKTESLSCILSLLGLPDDEIKQFSRGWVEAVGAGIDVCENDLVLRTTCVELSKDGEIKGTVKMAKSTQNNFYIIGSYQGVLVLKNKAKMLNDVKCFAPFENPGAKYEKVIPQGDDEILKFFIKNKTMVSAVVPWGQSVKNKAKTSYPEATMISGSAITKGIAKALKMKCVSSESATGDTDTNLKQKLSTALFLAKSSDFVCLHINGADEASHRLDANEKQLFLQRIDCEIIKPLLQSENNILVCSDHGTSPKNGAHLNMPQPFVLVSNKKEGNIGTLNATDAIKILKGQK